MEKDKDSAYYEKRIRAILETVLPGIQSTYVGQVLKEKEDALFSKIMAEFLPNQTLYTESAIREAFFMPGYIPPSKAGNALKEIVQTVAIGGIQQLEVRKTGNIRDMVMPVSYQAKPGVAG